MRPNPSSYIRPAPEGGRGCRAIPYAREVRPETVAAAVRWLLKELGCHRYGQRHKRRSDFPGESRFTEGTIA